MFEHDLTREHSSPAVDRIFGFCGESGWRSKQAEAYYDKLRRGGATPDEAFQYTLNRARNLAEQKARRKSHDTGAT